MSAVDLDAYFERIGWDGGTTPTLETLAGLQAAHMRHIPFENLDVLLGRPIRLDLDALQRKLVHSRRGGYCFEQCTLFGAVLEALGFTLQRHTARVTVRLPRHEAPRTHMILEVTLGGRSVIVDPGFGSLSPRVPLPLEHALTVRSAAESHTLVRDGPAWVMRVETEGQTVDAWVTTLDRDPAIDFELGNHFTSTHATSIFRQHLLLRAATDDGRIGVMNREVTIRRGDGIVTRRLEDRADLRRLLAEHFGIDLPEADTLRVPGIPEWSD
jgi:N-hydroxyarylamine O-acetyltransferase